MPVLWPFHLCFLWIVQHIAKSADAIEQMKFLHVTIPKATEAHLCGKSSKPNEAQVQALHDVAAQLLEDQAFVQSSMRATGVLKQDIAGINAVATRISKLKGASFKLIKGPQEGDHRPRCEGGLVLVDSRDLRGFKAFGQAAEDRAARALRCWFAHISLHA